MVWIGRQMLSFDRLIFFLMIGVHPFHINVEITNKAPVNFHGQFLLNSNAMDIDLQPFPSITYLTTGGIIDLYLFTGPTAADVIQQYWDVIGVRSEEFVFDLRDCFQV